MKATFVPISIFAATLLAAVGPIYGREDYDIADADLSCEGNFENVKLDQVNVKENQFLGGKIKVDGLQETCKCLLQVKFNAQKDGIENLMCYTSPAGPPGWLTPWKFDPKASKMVKSTIEEAYNKQSADPEDKPKAS